MSFIKKTYKKWNFNFMQLNGLYIDFSLSITYVLGFIIMALPSCSLADGRVEDAKRLNIYISAYRPSISTSVQLDSNLFGRGSDINLEDTAGLNYSETLGALSVSYRVFKRTWLDFSYFSLSRSASSQIDEEITFGNEVFNINETIRTYFDVDIARLGLGYAFYNAHDLSIGLAGGLHITKFDLGILAVDGESAQRVEETAPLPYLGVNVEYRIKTDWKLGGQIELFEIELDGIEGSLSSATLALEYSLSPSVGLGLGLNYYRLKVNADDIAEDLSGEFEYTYEGPLLYLRVGI